MRQQIEDFKTTAADQAATDQRPSYSEGSFNVAHDNNWRIFRIMAEFVDGFTFLAQFKRTITIFGSARFKEDNPYYQSSRQLAYKLAQDGYTIVTGGGPGIMEAANRGAAEAHGESVGLNIQLPTEQRNNPYVKRSQAFNYFYTRKVMLAFSAEAYIYFPGGFGTLDELFEIVNLQATKKIEEFIPVILFGADYWQPLLSWIQHSLVEQHETVSGKDFKTMLVADTVEDAFMLVKSCKPRSIQPYDKHYDRIDTREGGEQ